MKGDFTRLTFDPTKNYSRVMMQQGRVHLDADWNEMVEMQLHFLRTLAKDIIGPHGGPENSFNIQVIDNKKIQIMSGHYYVDGILCQNPSPLPYLEQSGVSQGNLENNKSYLLYLDVWERHLTHIEDRDQNKTPIREVALRGPDTATRTQTIWQIRPVELNSQDLPTKNDKDAERAKKLKDLGVSKLQDLPVVSNSSIKARTNMQRRDDNPCVLSPESRYRGAENQLYRIEIHRGGGLRDDNNPATFKWSRENGSVTFPINKIEGDVLILEHPGRDSRLGLQVDDWVEVVDDDSVLKHRYNVHPLLQVKEIDVEKMRVTLKSTPPSDVGTDISRHPILRRWDSGNEIRVDIPAENGGWITIEDGIEIRFEVGEDSLFQPGDYWLIPARTTTGDIDWPGPRDNPRPLPPHGVEHHYAPLAVVSIDRNGNISIVEDLRHTWEPIAK